jgi:uncharacterized repeat protein (TIGR04076 family)
LRKVKIEVIKKVFNEDLAKEYGHEGITGPCQRFEIGQTWYSSHNKPADFCDEAWKSLYQYVFGNAHKAEVYYDGSWCAKEGVAISACNNGITPVIFKIERIDEERTGEA